MIASTTVYSIECDLEMSDEASGNNESINACFVFEV